MNSTRQQVIFVVKQKCLAVRDEQEPRGNGIGEIVCYDYKILHRSSSANFKEKGTHRTQLGNLEFIAQVQTNFEDYSLSSTSNAS